MRFRRCLQWLRPWMPYFNFALAGASYWANEYWVQGFCQPVEWAAWVLAVSTAAFLLWPFAKKVPMLNYGLLFLMGVHFTVCVYCALFINPMQMLSTLLISFLVFPLLLWVPVVFAVQALNRTLVSLLPGARVVFGLGVVMLLPAQVWAELQYRQVETAVAQLPVGQQRQVEALLRVVPRNYMAERLAGALFKYHNYPEFIFDGWRPPLHDPLVNICLWSNDNANPLIVFYWDSKTDSPVGSLDTQVAFYHMLFPIYPVKADCACTQIWSAEGYHDWHWDWNSPVVNQRVRTMRGGLIKSDWVMGENVRDTYPEIPVDEVIKLNGYPKQQKSPLQSH